MDSKEIVKRVVVICTVCGLSFSILIGELGEILEGKAMKEHTHSDLDYEHVGDSVYLVSGTTASSAAISGDTLTGFSPGI